MQLSRKSICLLGCLLLFSLSGQASPIESYKCIFTDGNGLSNYLGLSTRQEFTFNINILSNTVIYKNRTYQALNAHDKNIVNWQTVYSNNIDDMQWENGFKEGYFHFVTFKKVDGQHVRVKESYFINFDDVTHKAKLIYYNFDLPNIDLQDTSLPARIAITVNGRCDIHYH